MGGAVAKRCVRIVDVFSDTGVCSRALVIDVSLPDVEVGEVCPHACLPTLIHTWDKDSSNDAAYPHRLFHFQVTVSAVAASSLAAS